MKKKTIILILVVTTILIASFSAVVSAAGTRYEADLATINKAQIYTGFPEATDGKCVGYVDFEDSYVDFAVTVETAGTYDLLMRVSTGDTGASHFLSVNGTQVAEVVYTAVGNGWGSFADYTRQITLQAGQNTIRIAKGNLYAAPDYIEISAASSPNPQTGDPSTLPLLLAAAASGAALLASIRKRK